MKITANTLHRDVKSAYGVALYGRDLVVLAELIRKDKRNAERRSQWYTDFDWARSVEVFLDRKGYSFTRMVTKKGSVATSECIASELVRVARELMGGKGDVRTASLGFHVVIIGGNVGGTIHVREYASFPSYGLDEISKMMRNFKNRVESKIISKVPAKLRGGGDVRMSSEGEGKRDILVYVEYFFEWKKQGMLKATLRFLKNNRDIKTLDMDTMTR